MKEFDQVMDCNMREGRISWFKGGMLNVTGKSSGKGEGGGDGARYRARDGVRVKGGLVNIVQQNP